MTDTYNIYGTSVTLDPDTGLPLLPHGMFWRVKRERVIDPPIRIELRAKTWYGSREIRHSWVDTIDEGAILHAAAFCYEQWREECATRRANRARSRQLDDLIGDYPPKKLEVNW